ncbi:MAG: nitroreductase family protein [Candidatus Acidiferrales bacterium]
MSQTLEAIAQRRAIKVFEPVEIAESVRDQILDAARRAPSSFNMQPYRLYWIDSPHKKQLAARLCMGQSPAATASALVVAVADIGSLEATSRLQSRWMRQAGFEEAKICEYERNAKIGRIIFAPGPFGMFGALKWLIFRIVHFWKTIGMPPVFRGDVFKWAGKSTSLACENLMIAAEALGLNTCPMEGFDGHRLSKFLGLSPRVHEIVMVVAIGKKSALHVDQPQWRRPLEATVTFL